MHKPVQHRCRPKKRCALRLEWLEDRRLLSGAKTILPAPLLNPVAASETVPAAIVQFVTYPADNRQNVLAEVSDRHAPGDQSSLPSVVQDVTSKSQESTSRDLVPAPLASSPSDPSLASQAAVQLLDNTQNSRGYSSDTQAPQSPLPGAVQDITTTNQDSTSSDSAPAPSDSSSSDQRLATPTIGQRLGHELTAGNAQPAIALTAANAQPAIDLSAADAQSSIDPSAADGQLATDPSGMAGQPVIDPSGTAGQPVIDPSGTDGQPAIDPSGADAQPASDGSTPSDAPAGSALSASGDQSASTGSGQDQIVSDSGLSSDSQANPIPVANTVQAETGQFAPTPVQVLSESATIAVSVVRTNLPSAGSSTMSDAGMASSTDLQPKHSAQADQQGRLAAGQDQSWLAAEMALAARKAADSVATVEQQVGSWAEKVSAEGERATDPSHASAYLGHTGQGKTEEVSGVGYGYGAALQTYGEPATILVLTPDVQQGDSDSEMSELSAQGSGLFTGFSLSDRAALDGVLQDFVRQLDYLGQDLSRSLGGLGLSPWLLTAAVAATVCEIGRRQRRSARSALGLAAGGEPTTLTWFAGLPGPLSTEES